MTPPKSRLLLVPGYGDDVVDTEQTIRIVQSCRRRLQAFAREFGEDKQKDQCSLKKNAKKTSGKREVPPPLLEALAC